MTEDMKSLFKKHGVLRDAKSLGIAIPIPEDIPDEPLPEDSPLADISITVGEYVKRWQYEDN